MLLLIWSIYVIAVGKYQLSWHYGVTGVAARFCGFFNLLVSLGVVSAFIPVSNPIASLLIQFGLIIIVGVLAVTIHGNDFKKKAVEVDGTTESGEYTSTDNRPKVTKSTALWKTSVTFIGYYLFFLLVTFGITILILNMSDIHSIPEIPNTFVRTITWIALPGIPFLLSLFLAYGRYNSYNIVQK